MRSFGTVFSDKGPTRNGIPCETANETVTPKTLPINEIQEIFDMKQLKKIAAAVLIAAMLGLLLPQLGVNAEALKRGSRRRPCAAASNKAAQLGLLQRNG